MNFKEMLYLTLFLPSLLLAQVDSTDIIIHNMMLKQKIVGLALAVVKNGKATVNKGYGYANAEHKVPVTSETVFRLASISKQFFATAIMKLQEDGKLTTEDFVHKYFPDAPQAWKDIQIKHLLSHTSGLKREAPAYDNYKIQSDLAVIKSAYPLPLDYKTGEKYQYCNLGYFILAEIVSQVSGMPWQEYIRQKLFQPAGMSNTYLTEFHPVIANRASGYRHSGDTLFNAEPMIGIRPSGGFLSTTSDMIKWDAIVTSQSNILKKENWVKLWQPFISTSSKAGSNSFYGFGWMIDEHKRHKTISHSGSNIGFKTFYSRFVNDRLSIIVLTNENDANPSAIVNALADYYLRNH